MNINALKRLLGEVLVETAGAEATSSNSVCERAFEDRMPEMFQARHEAMDVELSEASADRIVAKMLAKARGDIEFSPNGHIESGLWKDRRTTLLGKLAFAGLVAVGALVCVLVWNALQAPGTETPVVVTPPTPEDQVIPNDNVPNEEPSVIVELDPLDKRERTQVVERIEAGSLTQVMGEPLVYGPMGGKPIVAMAGTIIPLGSRIETGDMDTAEISLVDGSIVKLGFNTTLTIPAGATIARNLEMTSGWIVANVAPAPDASTFTVKTPVATAEVLGTEFSIELQKVTKGEPELRAVLQVKTGRVEFFNDFDPVVVEAMMESTAIAGEAPTEPQRVRVLKKYTVTFGRQHTHFVVTTSPLSDRTAIKRYVYPNGWTGLTLMTTPGGEVWVVEVAPGSPALDAGLEAGDIILALDGVPVQTSAQVASVTRLSPGTTFELQIDRRGQKLRVPLQPELNGLPLPEMPSAVADRLYGATRFAISGDHETSLRLLGELAEELPIAAAWNNLGVVHETRDSMGAAIRSYKEAIRLDPQSALYHLNLGLALKKIGNVLRFIEELETAVELAPSYHTAIENLADAYALVDRFDDSVAVLRAASERFPATPRFLLGESSVLIKALRFDEAIQAAERAVEHSPRSAYALSKLGDALKYGERFGKAETTFRKVIALNPFAAGTHSSLGQVLQKLGREEEAEAAHRKAIELNPSSVSYRVMFGMFLHDLGRYQDAETQYHEAILIDPDYALIYSNLGNTLFRAGRRGEAEKVFLRAIELDPDFVHAYVRLGAFYARTRRYAEAEPVLRKAIVLSPSDANPYHFLGVALAQQGHLQEAEPMYRKAIELDYFDAATTYSNLGAVLFNLNRLSEAEVLILKAIELYPWKVSNYDSLASLYYKQGRLQELAVVARQAIDVDPKTLRRYLALADLLDKLGEIQKAMAVYEDAVNAFPEDPSLYAALGWSQFENHNWEEAEKTFRKCLELDPKDADTRSRLAWLLGEMERYRESMAEYEKALADDPNNPYRYSSFGWSLMENHRWEDAVKVLQRGIEIDPSGRYAANVRINLGNALIHFGDFEQSDIVISEALESDPDDFEASSLWALLLAHKGIDLDEALARAKKSAEHEDAYALSWEILGFVHFKREEYDEAIAPLEKAAEEWGRSYQATDALVPLGKVYEAKGDVSSAKDAYRRALAIEPSNKEAAEALKRLGG